MHLQRNKSERELFFFRTHRKGHFESMSGATVTDQGVPQEREGKLRVCCYSVRCATVLKHVILQNLGVGRGKLFERYAPTWQTVAKRSMAHKLTKLILIYLGLTVLPLLALSQWTSSEEIQEISISMQTKVYIRLLPTRDQQ
jgi:hypothetical protein